MKSLKRFAVLLALCLLPTVLSLGGSGGCISPAAPPSPPLELPSGSGTATSASNTSGAAALTSTSTAFDASALVVSTFMKGVTAGPECLTDADCGSSGKNFYQLGEPLCDQGTNTCLIRCNADSDCTEIAQSGTCGTDSLTGKKVCEAHGEVCGTDSSTPQLLACTSGHHLVRSCIDETSEERTRINGEERTAVMHSTTLFAHFEDCVATFGGVQRTFNGDFRAIGQFVESVMTTGEVQTMNNEFGQVASQGGCTKNSDCGDNEETKCVCTSSDGLLRIYEDGLCAASAVGECRHALAAREHVQSYDVFSFGDSSKLSFSEAQTSGTVTGKVSLDMNTNGYEVSGDPGEIFTLTGSADVLQQALDSTAVDSTFSCTVEAKNPIEDSDCTCSGTDCP